MDSLSSFMYSQAHNLDFVNLILIDSIFYPGMPQMRLRLAFHFFI